MLQPIIFNRGATLAHIIKPIVETADLTAGALGTRKIAVHTAVKQGDPLAAFQMPSRVLQVRPTTAAIDARTVAPFGNPTASKQTWDLAKYLMFSRVHGQVLTDDIGNTTTSTKNAGDSIEMQILNQILSKYRMPLQNDLFGHWFWSATNFDPATDYTGTHSFETETIASYKKNEGFMQLLKDALDASAFSNYKTTGTSGGGIDVDGATLTTANAYALAAQMLQGAGRKLRAYNQNMPIEYRPFLALSHDFYHVLRRYVATTYNGVDAGYMLFTEGSDGKRSELGFAFEGYAVYNWGSIFDEYWETTNSTSKYNHMGLFMTPENLSAGINIQSPPTVANGEGGLIIQPRTEIEMGGATDIGLYIQSDTLINDTSLFSTVGLEQIDNS